MNCSGTFLFLFIFRSEIKRDVEKTAQITIRLNQKKKSLTGISLSFCVLRTRQKLYQKQRLHRDPSNSRPLYSILGGIIFFPFYLFSQDVNKKKQNTKIRLVRYRLCINMYS